MTPRLFLNKRLIPYARLSFSSKDSISLNSAEFQSLLAKPNGFLRYWKSKHRARRSGQTENSSEQGNLLFDDKNGD